MVVCTAIKEAINTARSFVDRKNKKERNIIDILMDLEIILPSVNVAVKTMEPGAPQSSEFLNKLKTAVWKVKDALDDYHADAIRQKLNGRGNVTQYASSSLWTLKSVFSPHKNREMFEKAIVRLNKVCCEAVDVNKGTLNDNDLRERSSTSAHRKKMDPGSREQIFGRDKEIKMVLDFIRVHDDPSSKGKEDNFNINVLPIVGVTGTGKTALAQTIYNNEAVKKRFQLQAWVGLSDNFDAIELVKETINSFKLDEPHYYRDDLGYFQYELLSIIKNKKFLLVLDDVWDSIVRYSCWERLRQVLANGATGSLVIVTTQWQSVARNMRAFPPITLDALPENDFWELFIHYAFGVHKSGKEEPSTQLSSKMKQKLLELTGKEIVTKLNRIPLEAVRIGCLLNARLDIQHWIAIRDSFDMCRVIGDSENITCPGAAYKNLNEELKQSLHFCAIFPKGYVFKKDKLVHMWIAHGFVQPNAWEDGELECGGKRLEDIGKERFDMLLDRCFFQPVDNGYVMHNFIRDLLIDISRDEFCIVDNHSRPIRVSTRHLALVSDNFGTFGGSWHEIVFGDSRYETIQTLMFFCNYRDPVGNALSTIFNKSSSLRLLDLSYMRIGPNGFLDIFAQLPHLRYLDLSFTGIKILPKSICCLYHLQVLNLTGCFFTKLPKKIINLINLRHLHASLEAISMISGIGKLINLQELEEFSLKPRKGYKIDELRSMNELGGRLCISNLENVKEKEAEECNLFEKTHLKCLVMKWDPNCEPKESYMDIAKHLQPPSNIRKLEILNYPWTHSPKWMIQNEVLSQLHHVQIESCNLEVLPPLGQLPFLEILILKNLQSVKKIDTELYGDSEVVFPWLVELTLSDMNKCEEWHGVQGREMFPYLRKVNIMSCPALKLLPDNLPRDLLELRISNCSNELEERYVVKIGTRFHT